MGVKLTPWFEGYVKPLREGWYEVKIQGFFREQVGYLWWNGRGWTDGKKKAYFPFFIYDQWRGLTKRAK